MGDEAGKSRQPGAAVEVRGNVEGGVKVAGRDIVTIRQEMRLSPSERRDRRNRLTFLQKVHSFWVEGVLEQSLHGAALVELGMEEQPDTVDHPWSLVLEALDHEKNRALPPGTKLVDVFDEMGGALLILGAPGSGKTTMLLELLRDTIARAEGDEDEPIPVVFNLSSWAENRKPLAEWLVDELGAKYLVPKKIGRAWVDDDELLLLLDGLDEVKPEHRERCVEAINGFRERHGLTPLAVCSRISDYEALTTHLRLEGAVLLQPLSYEQIDGYLQRAGDELAQLRAAVEGDPTLRDLAHSPLMLSIMTLAFVNISLDDAANLGSIDAQRKHLLNSYVQRMFKRRGMEDKYASKRARSWLAWLAQSMEKYDQTVFLIEHMQPSWLDTRAKRLIYTVCSRILGGTLWGLLLGSLIGAATGLAAGFLAEAAGIELPGEGSFVLHDLLAGLQSGAVFGTLAGLVVGLALGQGAKQGIRTVETLKWSPGWSPIGARNGAFSGLLVGLLVGFMWLATSHPITALALLACVAGHSMLGTLLGSLILGGLQSEEIRVSTTPNQGTWWSARNALIIGLGLGVVTSLFTGLFLILLHQSVTPKPDALQLIVDMALGQITGIILGCAGGFLFGGRAFSQHLILRIILTWVGRMPANYTRFLDHATDLILLRRVGRGYIFVHRLLLDYFAASMPERVGH